MSKPDLKPCPFCGGKAKLVQTLNDYKIQCQGCGVGTCEARSPKPTSLTQYDPIEVVTVTWNRRRTDLNPAEVEELKSKYESAYKEIHMLYDAVGELQKERESAVRDLKELIGTDDIEKCSYCKFDHEDCDLYEENCWQWRGVQEESL